MKKIHVVLLVVPIVLLSVFLINACENTAPVESPVNQLPEIDLQNMVNMEEVLRTLALALPDVMADEELAEVIYNEVNKNVEDEAYALWSEIADKPTPSGKTLRKTLDSKLATSLGKVKDVKITTETFDKDIRLQVYIHNFDKWNGKDKLQVAYTPLTINDVDVTELVVFKPNGKSYKMDVSDKDWEPEFPIAIIGLNESMPDDEYELGKVGSSAEIASSTGFYWTKIYTRKVRNLEPWWAGKAEMVVRTQSGYDCNSIEASTSNSRGSSCSSARSGTPAWINGYPRGAKSLSVYGAGGDDWVPIWVFEKDISSGHEWIIDSAILKVNSSHTSFWLESINQGQYYNCSSYVRCTYNWSWGCTGTHLDCSGWGGC